MQTEMAKKYWSAIKQKQQKHKTNILIVTKPLALVVPETHFKSAFHVPEKH